MTTDDPFEDLRRAIADALVTDIGQYREIVPETDRARIDLVRRVGRAIGRRDKIAVRTFETVAGAGMTEVWVVNVQPSATEDELAEARMRRRMRAAVEAASTAYRPEP